MSEEHYVWVSKYALTKGIIKVLATKCVSDDSWRKCTLHEGGFPVYLKEGSWHSSPEEAITKAEQMRKNRLASLKKQMKKLEELKFQAEP